MKVSDCYKERYHINRKHCKRDASISRRAEVGLLRKNKRFRSLFDAPSVVIVTLWELIRSQVNYGVEEKYLLWGLVFLKVYAKNEEIHCTIVGFPTKQEF
jgi:hypothetical protein